MQREDPDGIVILCDFCRRDWDGQEAMIEGHHGSILCLRCMQRALNEQKPLEGKFKCTLCLRFNMPPEMPRWHSPSHPESIVCQECLYQAAKAFARNPDNDFKWDYTKFPPAVHLPPPTPSPDSPPGESTETPPPAP